MKKWIQDMHMKKGALHEEMHVPEGKKIPKKKLEKAAHKKGILGKRARLAETLEGLHHKGKKHKESAHEREVMGGKKGDEKLHKKAVKRHKKEKIGKVMDEYKEGKLHSGSKKGPKVTNPKQAIVIAISEAKKVGKKHKK